MDVLRYFFNENLFNNIFFENLYHFYLFFLLVSMNKKKNKQQNNNNNNLCWILDNNLKDVLPYFFINLELNDIKNIRLVCRKFRLVIDDNHDKIFNLIFQLKIDQKIEKQVLEKIIKLNPIITSFRISGNIDCNIDLIQCIPNYTKELNLYSYKNKQLEKHEWFARYGRAIIINSKELELDLYQKKKLNEYELPKSIESLSLHCCTFPSKFWNSIPSSLSFLYFDNVRIIDENRESVMIEEFQSNLKKLYIQHYDLGYLKNFPTNIVDLTLRDVIISPDQISNLSKISSLSNLELNNLINRFIKITNFDLSNFDSLKNFIYQPLVDTGQYICFPPSILTLTLNECKYENFILNECKYENFKTSLPKSLINIKINKPYPSLISYLLKEENKLPLLNSINIIYGFNNGIFEVIYIPQMLRQYDQLKLFKINFDCLTAISSTNLDIMFSYIPPNLQQLQIDQCPEHYIDYIIELFPNNFYEKSKKNNLLFSFTKK